MQDLSNKIKTLIRVLIIENNEEKCSVMRDCFAPMDDFIFIFDQKSSMQEGLEQLKKQYYDICLLERQHFTQNSHKYHQEINNINHLMQIWSFSNLEAELVDFSVFELETDIFLMKCQIHKDTLSNAIQYIIKSYGVRKQLEYKIEEFKNSEQNFQKMANTNLDGLLVLNQSGAVIFSNPAAGQLYDCLPKDLIGKQLGIPVSSDKKTTLELVRQDGNTCIVEARFSKIKWANQNAFLVSLRDITEQERLLDALHKASIYDELTGIYNRREANRILQEEIERCLRYKQISSLIMFDVDRFKAINDTYGHSAGDKALQWIAKIIKEQIRSIDKIARFGGDEFILLLPSISGESGLIPANRIRKVIESKSCLIKIDKNHKFLLPLTISIGLVEIPKYGQSLEAVLKVVDRALYAAKKQGGNCVYLYKPSKVDFFK